MSTKQKIGIRVGDVRGVYELLEETSPIRFLCRCTRCQTVASISRAALIHKGVAKSRCHSCPKVDHKAYLKEYFSRFPNKKEEAKQYHRERAKRLRNDNYEEAISRDRAAKLKRKQRMEVDQEYAASCRAVIQAQKLRYKQDLDKWKRLKISHIKANAPKRGLDVTITEEDLVWVECCPILGITLDRCAPTNSPNCASVDRLNNSLGYIKGNVWIISRKANTMKNSASREELKAFGRWASSL